MDFILIYPIYNIGHFEIEFECISMLILQAEYVWLINILNFAIFSSNNNMYHSHIGQHLNALNYKHWETLKHLASLQFLYLVSSAVVTIHAFRCFTLGLICRKIYTYSFHFSQKNYLARHNVLVLCFSFIRKFLNGKLSFSHFVLCNNGIIICFTKIDDGHLMYPLFY